MSLFSRRVVWILSVLPPFAALALAVLYGLGFVPLRAPDAERYPVRGIDVSHHQGEIDWNAVRADRVHFAFIKATEGGDFLDPRFEENWRAAGEVGLPRGAYHFFTFCTPGIDQANHFLRTVPGGEGELPPVVDVEFTGNCLAWESLDAVRAELSAFLAVLRAKSGREPLIYLNHASHRRIVRGHFPSSPLWVRDLFFEPGAAHYGAWRFWQYDDGGRVDGVRGPVDLNVFTGDLPSFERFQR